AAKRILSRHGPSTVGWSQRPGGFLSACGHHLPQPLGSATAGKVSGLCPCRAACSSAEPRAWMQLRGTLAELDVVQPRVELAPAQQFLVPADVDDSALVHHHNPVGEDECRHPVCDDEDRAVLDELLQNLVDQL